MGNVVRSLLHTDRVDCIPTSGLRHRFDDDTTFTVQAHERYETTLSDSTQTTTDERDGGSDAVSTNEYKTFTTYDASGNVSSESTDHGDNNLYYDSRYVDSSYVSDASGHTLRNLGMGQELRSLVVNGEVIGQYGVANDVSQRKTIQTLDLDFGKQPAISS